MADISRDDFENSIKLCRTNLEVFEACLEYVRHAAKAITKENIGEVEKELEHNGKIVLIGNLEMSLRKLLDTGMKIEHAHHHVSKILDRIQPGKIYLLYDLLMNEVIFLISL